MIEAAALSSSPHDAAPRRRDGLSREDAPEFSYALAAASLERQASKSLEAHGARPADSAAPQTRQRAESGDPQGALKPARAEAEPNESRQKTAAASVAKAATSSAQPSIAHGNGLNAELPAPVAPAPIAAQSTLQTKAADAAAIRDASAAKAKLAAPKAVRLPAEHAALKAEFAEILARRLEKTSVFDLRLDPPDLGRVEGRLAVNDDGKSVLSLTFDNQSAFDLFSRDEQALRQALHQAGLNFSTGDFVFAFKDRSQPEGVTAAGEILGTGNTPAAYEPSFLASWSSGALDIRI